MNARSKTHSRSTTRHTAARRRLRSSMLSAILAMLLASCQSMDPRNVDVTLPDTRPQAKVTSYTDTLSRLGDMTEIYASDVLKIQSNPIRDNTGASQPTGGEIPRDITEMIKTALNSIGGHVVFIPYDPAFVQNQAVTGYSNFEKKLIPNIVLSGGITEFDRGLLTRGENTDVSLEYEVSSIPDALPSKNLGVRYGDEARAGLARITLDFNLLDFRTLSGIPRINAVNTMEVNKALGNRELGISLFGQNFGLKGTVKKVQGRHAAVRLLVELSMIQIVGKYLAIPYWRLLGDDAQPDPVVLNAITRYYTSLTQDQVNHTVQQWLTVYGYQMALTHDLDAATSEALAEIDPEFPADATSIGPETFTTVYLNLPLSAEATQHRKELAQRLRAMAEQQRLASTHPQTKPTPAKTTQRTMVPSQKKRTTTSVATTAAATPAVTKTSNAQDNVRRRAVPVKTTPLPSAKTDTVERSKTNAAAGKRTTRASSSAQPLPQPIIRTGIGRFLTEEEW